MLKKVLLVSSLVLASIFANAQVGVGTTDPKSSFEVQGSMGYKVTTITSATTLTDDHHVILCNNGPYTVTLPPAAANASRVYRIKNIDAQSDVITIDGNGSETIDGDLTYALQPYKHSITLISDGANWYVIENLSEGGVQVGAISTIDCAGATANGTLVNGVVASSVSSVIAYTGGNAGPHNGQIVTSTGVTGLTATLVADNFAPGNGSLTYTITGTPTSSGTATFAINIGGQTCNLTRTVNTGAISTIDCAGATANGTLVNGVVASSVSSVIAYTGGNAGPHSGQTVTSTGVTGLTATLTGGTFASGSGNLTYTITGTPTSSGTATFAINIGGQTCNLTRTVNAGSIATITCGSATNSGTLFSGTAASGVSSAIPYTGGNGGTHTGQTVTSTGVTGLTATLTGGNFASGSGNLTYTITGTPASTGTATFAINIGGQTCTLNRTVGVASSGGTAVVSTWTSTVGCSVGAGTNNSPAGIIRGAVNETMAQGVAAPSSASITLVANVTTAGTYTISTNTLNGVTFSASGTFGSTGSQTVTLTPSGTPTAAGNFKWATTLTPSIDVYGSVLSTNAPLGSTYTTHFNGISGGVSTNNLLATYTTGETFNSNATCASKPISAQGCAGVSTVTDGGRTYNTVAINGQCWLQSNLITAPSVYSTYTTGSWTNTSPGDQGYWGYYHDVTTNGTAGWKATEPAANEGRMYQWCGAMDATISERSRGICPAGWHVPSDCEWMYLEHGQGMSIAFQTTDNAWRANDADNQGTPGYKLRSQGTGQTNASGFSGLLAGVRTTTGTFLNRTSNGDWWSSSAAGADASYRALATGNRGVRRLSVSKAAGFSVRCLKD